MHLHLHVTMHSDVVASLHSAAAAAKDTLDELWNKYFHLITFPRELR